jgi:hypothetical protein
MTMNRHGERTGSSALSFGGSPAAFFPGLGHACGFPAPSRAGLAERGAIAFDCCNARQTDFTPSTGPVARFS